MASKSLEERVRAMCLDGHRHDWVCYDELDESSRAEAFERHWLRLVGRRPTIHEILRGELPKEPSDE